MKNFPLGRTSPSFALISVLALVSLAALSATAFLASARLERLASRPLADVTRLEMASGTGLAMAMGVLAQAGNTNYGLQRVVTYWRTNEMDDLGYLLVGTFADPANPLAVTFLPAFSSTLMIANALDPASVQTNATQVIGQGNYRANAFAGSWTSGLSAANSTSVPLLGNQTSPPVAWIPIRQERRVRPGSAATTTVQVARVAFYVQDLQGLIDAERMGGSNNRTTGTNPAEISLTNLSGTALMSATTASNFVAPTNRRLFASVGMLRSAGGLAANDLRYVATGLRSWGWSNASADAYSNRIPPGIQVAANQGYRSPGQVKSDLNAYSSSASLETLATLLRDNLPEFGQRAGGLTNANRFDYYKCLAANIVDYIDSDQNPSIQTGPGGYRGTEALPFVSEVAMSIHWTNQSRSGVQFQEEFEVVHVVEFWNMFNKAFSGTVNFGYASTLSAQVGLTPSFSLGSPVFLTAGTLTNAYNVSLAPNEFRAYASPPIRYRVLSGVVNPPTYGGPASANRATNGGFITFGRPGSPASDNYTSGWRLSYGGATYDETTAIEEPTFTVRCEPFVSGNFRLPDFKNHQPALRLDPPNPTGEVLFGPGDLRMSYFMTNSTSASRGIFNASTFTDSASLGYRNTIWAYTDRKGSTNRPDLWLDGGHANSSPGPGKSPGVEMRIYLANGSPNPAFAPSLAAHTPSTAVQLEAPAYIADAAMTNVLELGRIFDPIQWRTAIPMTAAAPQAANPTNITATSLADFQQGGGNTLRIGRPEHSRFAFTTFTNNGIAGDPVPNMGMSAVALLDLFRIGSADSNSFTGGGKINLNTAPAPVLAALAGGINLTNDPSRTPTSAPANANMINAFTQGVLRFRSLYPFYSPSQLSFISTDYGVGTTWTNTWDNTAVFSTNAGAGLAGVTALNDAGREEWFSRIHGLTSVDSLNFRCYVVSQLTQTNGDPRGALYRKYYQIYTAPNPAALTNAALPPFRPVVVEEGTY